MTSSDKVFIRHSKMPIISLKYLYWREPEKTFLMEFSVHNFVIGFIGFYCRCLEILCQIALSSIANYFRSYRKKQFGIRYFAIEVYNKVVSYTANVYWQTTDKLLFKSVISTVRWIRKLDIIKCAINKQNMFEE